MLKVLFLEMLKRTCDSYGDCLMDDVGLAPVALATPKPFNSSDQFDLSFWQRECESRPHQIACLNYDT